MPLLFTSNVLRHKLADEKDISGILAHMFEHCREAKSVAGSLSQAEGVPGSPNRVNNACEELSIKLYLKPSQTPEDTREYASQAVEVIIDKFWSSELKNSINQFIISIDGYTSPQSQASSQCADAGDFKDAKSTWLDAAAAVNSFFKKSDIRPVSYGVSEFSASDLVSIIQEITQLKLPVPLPTVDSINTTDCCSLSHELLELCESRNIKVTPSSDPIKILPDDKFRSVLEHNSDAIDETEIADWKWIVKLTSICKQRQVLVDAEYVISY